nr:Unknown Function [uncultured bacterium]
MLATKVDPRSIGLVALGTLFAISLLLLYGAQGKIESAEGRADAAETEMWQHRHQEKTARMHERELKEGKAAQWHAENLKERQAKARKKLEQIIQQEADESRRKNLESLLHDDLRDETVSQSNPQ